VLISFEVTFVLYLYAGLFKADARLGWIPFDLTAAFFAVNVTSGIFILARRRWFVSRAAIEIGLTYLLFAGWAITTLLWTPGVVYAREKAVQLCTLVLWAVVGPALVIATDEARVRRLFSALVLLALWVGTEAVLAFSSSAKDQVINVLGGKYLGPSRLINIAALLLTLNAVLFAKSLRDVLLSGGGAIVMVVLLLLIGGRGPLLATGIALLVPVGLGVTLARKDVIRVRPFAAYIGLAMTGGVVVVIYLVASGHMTTTLNRLAILLNAEPGRSGALRLEYYAAAMRLWSQHPLIGAGVGSWPLLADKGDIRYYPHNIVLELLSEFGLVGAYLWFAFIAVGLRVVKRIDRVRKDPRCVLLVTLLAATLFNASVSGDLNDNRIVFVVIGLFPLVASVSLDQRVTRGTAQAGPSSFEGLVSPDVPYA